jgi:hypothetical protein
VLNFNPRYYILLKFLLTHLLPPPIFGLISMFITFSIPNDYSVNYSPSSHIKHEKLNNIKWDSLMVTTWANCYGPKQLFLFTHLLGGNYIQIIFTCPKSKLSFIAALHPKLVHIGYFIVVSGDGCIQVQHLIHPMVIAPPPPLSTNTTSLTKWAIVRLDDNRFFEGLFHKT